jgi:hypothetical protein
MTADDRSRVSTFFKRILIIDFAFCKAQTKHTEIVCKYTIFVVAALLIKPPKQQYEKKPKQKHWLCIKCMDLVVVVPK